MITLICATTIAINLSLVHWDKEDEKNLERAQARCSQLYPEAPCLKKFVKSYALTYRATCSEPIKKKFACLQD
jgi:hypothetical protein